jgi:putative Holliday junction resolvase
MRVLLRNTILVIGGCMRVLGLDYGEKRIGVAVSDELGLTAQGLETVHRKNMAHDVESIGSIARNLNVEKIVLGYPLRLNGEEGIQCAKVKRFARQLETALSLPIVFQDETLTTKEAESILAEANVRKEKRKLLVDKIAASIILQAYLDSIRKNGIDQNIR